MDIKITEKNGRKLVWNDEFDGKIIDKSKWSFDRSMNNGSVYYDNGENTVKIKDGCACLSAVYGDFPDGKKISLPEGFTTKNRMYFKYGYIEIRAKIPFGKGVWPSFWMKSNTPYAKAPYLAETDIFENFADDSEIVSNMHKWGKDGLHSMINWQTYRGFKFDENCKTGDFHTFGLEWDKSEMKFSVDGKVYYSHGIDAASDFDNEVLPGMDGFHDFAYIIMNNELMTEAIVKRMTQFEAIKPETLPVNYYIDYVRLYQKEGEEIIIEKSETE